MSYRNRAELAEELRRLREEHGVTQREVADLLAMDPSSMNRIEKGERGVSTGELVLLADRFGVSVDSLLRTDEPALALRAECDAETVDDGLAFFREVIADYFAVETLANP